MSVTHLVNAVRWAERGIELLGIQIQVWRIMFEEDQVELAVMEASRNRIRRENLEHWLKAFKRELERRGISGESYHLD